MLETWKRCIPKKRVTAIHPILSLKKTEGNNSSAASRKAVKALNLEKFQKTG